MTFSLNGGSAIVATNWRNELPPAGHRVVTCTHCAVLFTFRNKAVLQQAKYVLASRRAFKRLNGEEPAVGLEVALYCIKPH